MICCWSGKARVYYNIPTQGGLKYKLKNSTKWITILGNETLTSSCIISAGTTVNFACNQSQNFDSRSFPYKVSIVELIGGTRVAFWNIVCKRQDNNENLSIETRCDRNAEAPNYFLSGNTTSIFTITGTETGTKYLEIEVDECPAVQTIPCKFDPAKERYRDVEMAFNDRIKTCIVIAYPGQQLPAPGTTVPDDLIMIFKTQEINSDAFPDGKPNIKPIPFVALFNIPVTKGCPLPQVRVECCTTPDCQNNKKCPKGTTCEIVCGGFKCCYIKGKLVRSIKL